MKPMLSTEELILHMKEKGITFRETSEEDAKNFLEHNNYYMKLAAYRSNYEKCAEGKRKRKISESGFCIFAGVVPAGYASAAFDFGNVSGH